MQRKKAIIIGGIAAGILLVGGIAAAGNKGSSTAASVAPTEVTKTVTVTAPPVTKTVTAPPVTVTAPPPVPVTVTAQPNAATTDPAGPKKDGKFMVGSQIEPGTWQCDKPGSFPFWTVHDQANGIVDNGLDSIAIITEEGYTAELDGCASTWVKVG